MLTTWYIFTWTLHASFVRQRQRDSPAHHLTLVLVWSVVGKNIILGFSRKNMPQVAAEKTKTNKKHGAVTHTSARLYNEARVRFMLQQKKREEKSGPLICVTNGKSSSWPAQPVVVAVALTLTRIIKPVVKGQAPATLKRKNTQVRII